MWERIQRPPVIWGSVTEGEVVRKAVEGQDVVVHMAARASVQDSIQSPEANYWVNAYGTLQVLEAVRQEGCRLILASSCEVYGTTDVEFWFEGAPPPAGLLRSQSEEHALRPHSPYAAGKVAGDRLAYAYWKTYDLPVTILRPCNIYGPRQRPGPEGAVIPTFARAARAGGTLRLHGGGTQQREYLHVDDLVRAYDTVLHCDDGRLNGEVLNVGSGQRISIRAIAEFLVNALGGQIESEEARPGAVSAFFLDSLLMRGLGWAPQVDFWEGLEDYVVRVRQGQEDCW